MPQSVTTMPWLRGIAERHLHDQLVDIVLPYRFGEHLACEANRWLAIANAPIRLTGSPAVHTTLEKVTDPDAILNAVSRLSDEARADITVSTAHKAKGREWSSVRIAADFTEPEDPANVNAAGEPLPGKIDEAEARLAYVAVTRAQHRLDLGGLSWINRHLDGNPLGRR